MAGPLGERCGACYYWDIDVITQTTKKGRFAECCLDAPHKRAEVFEPNENKWCSDYLEREYGKIVYSESEE